MMLAHKIRLYPNTTQEEYFRKACGTARFVYNQALAEWNTRYAAGEKPKAAELKKEFNARKYEDHPWLKEVHRDAYSQPFADLDKAFKNFFKGVAKHPTFKKKGRSKESFYVASDKFSMVGHTVRLPKIGKIKTAEELRFTGDIKSARVSCTAGLWFISVQVDCTKSPAKSKTAEIPIGIDLGIKTTATCTDGSVYRSPKAHKRRLKRLRRLSRSLAKKRKGSNNRIKAVRKLSREHLKVSNIRADFIHKMTTEIVSKSQAIVLEDLAVGNMLKNRKLARALADESFAEIRRQFSYKCQLYKVPLLVTDRYFPSSKLCHRCGWKNMDLKLSDRTFKCPECGLQMDRDLNASFNLLNQLPEAIGEVKPVDR